MKNDYRINSDGSTTIFIDSRVHGRMETSIDSEDLPRVKEARSWVAQWSEGTESFYVTGYFGKVGGKVKYVGLHRHILGLTDSKQHVDHIYHDTLDNRKSRLRVVTNAENQQNARKFISNTSGVTGVYWNKARGKWRAQIKVDGKLKHLGYFANKDEAIAARKQAEREFFLYRQSIKRPTPAIITDDSTQVYHVSPELVNEQVGFNFEGVSAQ